MFMEWLGIRFQNFWTTIPRGLREFLQPGFQGALIKKCRSDKCFQASKNPKELIPQQPFSSVEKIGDMNEQAVSWDIMGLVGFFFRGFLYRAQRAETTTPIIPWHLPQGLTLPTHS